MRGRDAGEAGAGSVPPGGGATGSGPDQVRWAAVAAGGGREDGGKSKEKEGEGKERKHASTAASLARAHMYVYKYSCIL